MTRGHRYTSYYLVEWKVIIVTWGCFPVCGRSMNLLRLSAAVKVVRLRVLQLLCHNLWQWDSWFCTHLHKNSIIQGYAPARFSQDTSSGIAFPAATVQIVLLCRSLMVEQATKCCQRRGVPLYPQDSPWRPQETSSDNTYSLNTCNTNSLCPLHIRSLLFTWSPIFRLIEQVLHWALTSSSPTVLKL